MPLFQKLMVLVVITIVSFSSLAIAQATKCSDGFDNDGDGKIDALVEISAAQSTAQASLLSSSIVKAFVASQSNELFVKHLGGGDHGRNVNYDAQSALRTCNLLGYARVTS